MGSALPQTFIARYIWGLPPTPISKGSPMSPCRSTQPQQRPKPQPCPMDELTQGNQDSPPSLSWGN